MREVEDKTILDRFAEEFASTVEKHCRYVIVSGYVVIAHGRSRGTEDIDMIVERVREEEFEKLHQDLQRGGFECLQGNNPTSLYKDYLKEDLALRYTWEDKHLPEMEFKLAKDELDEQQLENRTKLPKTGLDLYFSSVETNIAFKEELLKSEKDLEDAKHLRIVYEDELDEDEIERVKKKIRRVRLGKR